MGLFTNDDKPAGTSSEIALISEGLSITGEINATDNVYINGSFKGRIVAQGEVSIGPKGRVDGEILTKSLQVSGLLEGNIECETITIFPTGKVIGNLCSSTLEVYTGGYFFGENRLRKQSPAPTAASISAVVAESAKAVHLSVVTTMPLPKELDNPSATTTAQGKKHAHSKNEPGARNRSNTNSSITPATAKTENNNPPQDTVDQDQVEPALLKGASESRRWHSPWGRK